MTDLQHREPTQAEMMQSLARAMRRLGGNGDDTTAAIQNQMETGANFAVAARTIDVPLDDLIATFRSEMGKLGFVVAPTGMVQ
jgi:hypothetical protein